MEQEKLNKINNYQLIYTEARDLLNEQITSFRKVTDKSYVLVTFIFSIQTYAVNNILNSNNEIFNLVLILVFIIPIAIIFPNLLPRKMSVLGAEPSQMIKLLEYTESLSKDTSVDFIKYRLDDLQEDINANNREISESNKRLKNAVTASFGCLFLFAILWFCIRCLFR